METAILTIVFAMWTRYLNELFSVNKLCLNYDGS